MKFEEYVEMRLEAAKLEEDYDPEGNNARAVINRGFFKQLKLNAKHVNAEFKDMIHETVPLLANALFQTVLILAFPITYPVILVSTVVVTRSNAKRGMMKGYIEYKAKELHR